MSEFVPRELPKGPEGEEPCLLGSHTAPSSLAYAHA